MPAAVILLISKELPASGGHSGESNTPQDPIYKQIIHAEPGGRISLFKQFLNRFGGLLPTKFGVGAKAIKLVGGVNAFGL